MIKEWDAVPHSWPNFNGGLSKLPLKLGHGWLIISHVKQCIWLPIHALLAINLLSKKGPTWRPVKKSLGQDEMINVNNNILQWPEQVPNETHAGSSKLILDQF